MFVHLRLVTEVSYLQTEYERVSFAGIASTLQYDNNAFFCLFLPKWAKSAYFRCFSKVYAFMGEDAKYVYQG